ncbi:MAG: putative sigma factor, partial [Myxococcaceae bacterium]|nr:putative sigma factor [Myxococcaceae bacterium]
MHASGRVSSSAARKVLRAVIALSSLKTRMDVGSLVVQKPVAPSAPEVAAEAAALARAAAAGDTAATTRLLRLLAPELARVVRGVMGPHSADLDDAVQQSLVALVHALPAFRNECSPAGYACRIAFRTALAVRKRARAAQAREEATELDESHEQPAPATESTRRTELLRQLLEQLPPDQAEALAMRTMLGWSLEEIAASSGVPLNTVRSRLR